MDISFCLHFVFEVAFCSMHMHFISGNRWVVNTYMTVDYIHHFVQPSPAARNRSAAINLVVPIF